MITGAQPKILLDLKEDGDLVINEGFADLTKIYFKEMEQNWKLVRERDYLTKYSADVMWLEYNDLNGEFKKEHKYIKVGYNLIMSPFNPSYTWQTTSVTEIVEQRDGYVKFKTDNSTYELFKL